MAPSRTSTIKSKHAPNKSGIKNSKTSSKARTSDGVSKKSPNSKRTTSKGVALGSVTGKSKSKLLRGGRKKRRVYTEKELGVPVLNMVTPVGVEKPRGGKRGKVFVDDRESMLTILSLVHAEKDGQIESKMMKARQMEEIREARKAEAEKRVEERKSKLDETKEGLKKKRKRASAAREVEGEGGRREEEVKGTKALKLKKKTVSFA
ncbi:hypothetical protein HYFRA_00005094 [Hymenoscyphus fraxineus]|uniref:60S ribosomal subunit assembly/export protein LOC1 n=1 Tax=Hymenoscyphus fraxineus TaxID=746836 RepID=A0A9N9LEN4_9HELO|nr:hypothetical protein HYFRA_00005094 [Hymenoscyphus fraxineus]